MVFVEPRRVTAFMLMVLGALHLRGKQVRYCESTLNNIIKEEK